MCCSYCGKEIGTFRLLRDSEFCSALHRKKYGERLGKALHEIAAPEPAPADIAGFLLQMPVQQGNLTSTLILQQTVTVQHRIRTGAHWPLTIDTSDATSDATRDPAAVPERALVECPPRSERWMPAPPAEPVAAFVQASAALVQASAALAPAHILCIPRFAAEPEPAPQFTAELEPFPVPDQPLEPPAMCQQWMPAPAADPVFRYLQASIAPTVAVPAALKAPALALCIAAPHVPWIAQSQSIPHAEPVMAAVRPRAANAPLVPIRQEGAIALPAIPQVAQEPFAAARPAATPAPEAVESLLVAAQAAVPVSSERAPCRSVELAAPPAVFEPAPAIGKPVAGPAPTAAESLLVASAATPMAPAAAVRMMPFAMAGSQKRTVASFDAQRLAPAARKPDAAALRLVPPQPIATVAVAAPAHARPRLESALPRPGLLPVEFHSHRLRSAPVARPEWMLTRPALVPPLFLLRPVLEKLEDLTPQQKTARQGTGFGEIRKMPVAKRPTSVLMVAARVAAGFLLAASLWFGVANSRGDRDLAAHEEVSSGDAALSAANRASSVRIFNSGAPAQPAAKGPVAWVRKAIANRAALELAENFSGMENWDSGAKADPAGWSRHPEGYVNTGALALFRPSLKFTDYHMEFFGQIETKSIGWTMRAADTRNYHAMKLTVVEAGLRPFVALVHYDVVNGKSGHRTQTPLNVMVHNNRPMQFTVDVRGNRFVTSIDGEEVDSFIDNTLVAGGVGFFSEAGERARLYWMRVSHNDDWLGHVCAQLAEGIGVGSTAELRRPELPGGAPTPGLPGDRDGMTLAAMWMGLPYLRGTRKARFLKTWRSEPWNT